VTLESASFGRRLFADLLTVEVNTLIHRSASGRKMPEVPAALHEIGADFRAFLAELATTGSRSLAQEKARSQTPSAVSDSPPPPEEFLKLAHAARSLADSSANGNPTEADIAADLSLSEDDISVAPAIEPEEEVQRVLSRIAWSSDYLRTVSQSARADPSSLSPYDLMVLRKIWELGVETIAVQTVVQADGDIIGRLHAGIDGIPPGALQQFHQDMVSQSVTHWRLMFETAAVILQTVGGFFFRGNRPQTG
jgi:hypothetical protein